MIDIEEASEHFKRLLSFTVFPASNGFHPIGLGLLELT